MNGEIEHDKAEALLPWYANGALEGRELRQVATHLESCDRCREELKFLGDVRAVLRVSTAAEQAAPIMRNARFGSLPLELQQRVLASPQRRLRKRHWMPAVAAGFLAAIGLGVALTVAYMDAPRYRTATSGATAAGEDAVLVMVRFVPHVAMGEMNTLLRQHDAVVVEGPDSADRWLLEIPVTHMSNAETLLPALRSTPGIESVALVSSRTETE